MPAINHLHYYVKLRTRPGYYKCNHPLCSHYTAVEFLLGKMASCKCDKQFVLNSKDLKMYRPVCPNCSQRKSNKLLQNAQKVVDQLAIEEFE